MDRIQLNGVWYIKESLTLQDERYQPDYSIINLDVITYRNGDSIPEVKNPKEWKKLTTGAYCYYDNDPSKGILYNWYAVNDPRNLAPLGWKIPNNKEIDSLHLKRNSQFNGFCERNGVFHGFDDYVFWWTSSESTMNKAWARYLSKNYDNIYKNNSLKKDGCSVRCVKESLYINY